MTHTLSISQILDPFRIMIEEKIEDSIHIFGEKSQLRDACEYALRNGGKRFRPALVFIIAKALGSGIDVSSAALAVEFFHTASLIADDLPCMDNDDLRRNLPSVHKVYGEPVALLATYALISAGYSLIVKSGSEKVSLLAIENASLNTGALGAAGGQFLDIYPPDLSPESLFDIIQKKTGTLFEISFVFGWLFGGGALDKLELIKKASRHFGLAFQIADDLGDMDQDKKNGRLINVANVCGKEQAFRLFQEEIFQFRSLLKQVNLHSEELNALVELL